MSSPITETRKAWAALSATTIPAITRQRTISEGMKGGLKSRACECQEKLASQLAAGRGLFTIT